MQKLWRLPIVAILMLGQVAPAACLIRGGAAPGSKNPLAKAVLNLGSDKTTQSMINVLKACTLNSTGTASDFFKLDLTGYPTSAPSGGNFAWSCGGQLFPSTSYRFRIAATRPTTFIVNSSGWGACTVISGTVTTNCNTGGAQGGQFTIQTAAQAQDAVIQITTPSGTPSLSAFFPSTGTYAAGTGEIALYRTSDEAAYLAGQVVTPEYVSEVKGAGPAVCRMMGLINTNFNGEVKWAYRVQPTNFGWGGSQYPPTIVNPAAGAVLTGTDTYVGQAATDTPGSITAGEMYIAIIGVANDGVTAPTLNIGGRGPVQILNDLGNVPAANELKAGQIYTFWYDQVLNAYITNEDQFGVKGSGGISSGMPIEVQAKIANALNCDLWSNLPVWADSTYAANWSSTVNAILNSWLFFYAEVSNETWNQAFFAYYWMLARGLALGFPTTGFSPRPSYSYYGLAVKQMANNIASSWGGLPSARLRITLNNATIPSLTSSTESYRMEGADLVPGNSAYNTFTGSANYSVAPNRPVDIAYSHGEAPYVGGTNLCTGADVNCTIVAANSSFYQSLINAWEGGNTAAAIALVDNDIRQGVTGSQTVTASGTTFTTPAAHGFVVNSVVQFNVTGGTSYSGIPTYSPTNASAQYQVTSVSSAGCPGAVTCNFTVQGFTGSIASGANINAGSAGTGTLSVGQTGTGRSMLFAVTAMLQYIEGISERYNGGAGGTRPAGFGPLMSLAYEANLEPQGPQTFAQCTTLALTYPSPTTINVTANTNSNTSLTGISSTAGILFGMTVTGTNIQAGTIVTSVGPSSINISLAATGTATGVSITTTANCISDSAQAIAAWQGDPSAAQTEWDYLKQYNGTYQGAANYGLMTYSQGSSQLVNLGGGLYGLLPSSSLTAPIVPRQTYYGFGSFNTNWLLGRDLDPALNDNEPMWLEKAA